MGDKLPPQQIFEFFHLKVVYQCIFDAQCMKQQDVKPANGANVLDILTLEEHTCSPSGYAYAAYASCLLLKPFAAFAQLLEFRLESVDAVEILVAEFNLFQQITI